MLILDPKWQNSWLPGQFSQIFFITIWLENSVRCFNYFRVSAQRAGTQHLTAGRHSILGKPQRSLARWKSRESRKRQGRLGQSEPWLWVWRKLILGAILVIISFMLRKPHTVLWQSLLTTTGISLPITSSTSAFGQNNNQQK